MLHHQLPWYVGGPVLGLCVVAMRWLINERLGVTGAWSELVERLSSRSLRLDTRGWFLAATFFATAIGVSFLVAAVIR